MYKSKNIRTTKNYMISPYGCTCKALSISISSTLEIPEISNKTRINKKEHTVK